MPLDSLPDELWLRIFFFGDALSLRALATVCRLFKSIIAESRFLQLSLELEEGGLRLLSPSTSSEETLRLVRSSRRAWQTLSPSFRTSIAVPFVPGSLYELSGGYFFLSVETGTLRPRVIAYVRLPHIDDDLGDVDEVQTAAPWQSVQFNEDIIDFAIDVDQDFLCFVQHIPTQLPQGRFRQIYRVHFRQMSDGKPHPGAKEVAVEHVVESDSPFAHVSVVIQVVGDHVVIMFSGRLNIARLDSLAVWDWTTGQLKGTVGVSEPKSIHTFVMLSPCQFLLAPPATRHLEVYRFDTSRTQPPTPLRCEARFELPPSYIVQTVIFRAEPASFNSTPYTGPRRPFGVEPEKGIVSFTVQLATQTEGFMRRFIARRQTFLDYGALETVPWTAWRHLTRWDAIEWPPNWICYTMGARHVMLGSGDDASGEIVPDGEETPIRVQDFDPALLRDVRSGRLGVPEDGNIEVHIREAGTAGIPDSDADEIENENESRDAKHESEDAKPVLGLPCVEITTKQTFDFAGILLDEDRIIGLTVNARGDITDLDVFLMGGVRRARQDESTQ
ncbi:hypothetical protein EXIGLDRAFT_754650 [Exidia glandulosa HHB12029]|uniref:F-box domain-containing protein n=1 Tax=Exidia glandulosa HHB12029 TaxID=1314781 RepID=A0A165CRJ2_EXIGL|nr:hypothetical protein EXIGLDRAFT_754650 [Exidia glandulosa HHB12029]